MILSVHVVFHVANVMWWFLSSIFQVIGSLRSHTNSKSPEVFIS